MGLDPADATPGAASPAAPTKGEPMSKLSRYEREDLENILASPEFDSPAVQADREVGRQLADLWREDLTDVDDVVIGRVMLRAAVTLTQLSDAGVAAGRVANILTLSALDLTSSELGGSAARPDDTAKPHDNGKPGDTTG
jgi:hypothetical protein